LTGILALIVVPLIYYMVYRNAPAVKPDDR
jgi:hypothetical protein